MSDPPNRHADGTGSTHSLLGDPAGGPLLGFGDAPPDFTFATYRTLLDAIRDGGYRILTVADYLSGTRLPDRFVVLRHDVDRKPRNALAMARLEAAEGVASTYYFRTGHRSFRPPIVERVGALGHEVGYHYEDLDRASGDVRAAHESFASNLADLRALWPVETVCMHGNPLTPHDNREMWLDGTADFDDYDLLGEAFLSMDFSDVAYFSDTGRTWYDNGLKVKDHPMGESHKPVQVRTTRELVRLFRDRRLRRACLVVHPNRWARTAPELLVEWTKDVLINIGKRGVTLVGRR